MARLRLVPTSGSPIEIDQDETVVGRDPSCDVVVSDGSVSRRHVKIERRGDAWHLNDQGSANGTFVDTRRVAEAELKDGQALRLGAVDFKVEIEGDLAATIAMSPEGLAPGAPTAPSLPPRPAAPPPSPAAPPGATPPSPPPPRPAAGPPPAAPPPARPSAPPPPAGGARVPPPAGASPVSSMGPGGPPPAQKGRGPVFWGLVGCCGCLLLAALVGGGIALFGGAGFFGMLQEPVTAVQDVLQDLKAGRDQEAWERLSSGHRARVDRDDFSALVALHPALRNNKDASFTSRSIQNDRALLKDAVLTAESGEVEHMTFELIKEGGEWKIDRIAFAAGDDSYAPVSGLRLATAGVNRGRDGDSIKVEIELVVSGYKLRPSDEGESVFDLVEDVETLGPDGRRIDSLSKEAIEHRRTSTSEAAPPPQNFTTTLTIDPNSSPGLYTVRLTVHDRIAGAQQTHVANFTLP